MENFRNNFRCSFNDDICCLLCEKRENSRTSKLIEFTKISQDASHVAEKEEDEEERDPETEDI
jgi:hypothetical protein